MASINLSKKYTTCNTNELISYDKININFELQKKLFLPQPLQHKTLQLVLSFPELLNSELYIITAIPLVTSKNRTITFTQLYTNLEKHIKRISLS